MCSPAPQARGLKGNSRCIFSLHQNNPTAEGSRLGAPASRGQSLRASGWAWKEQPWEAGGGQGPDRQTDRQTIEGNSGKPKSQAQTTGLGVAADPIDTPGLENLRPLSAVKGSDLQHLDEAAQGTAPHLESRPPETRTPQNLATPQGRLGGRSPFPQVQGTVNAGPELNTPTGLTHPPASTVEAQT